MSRFKEGNYFHRSQKGDYVGERGLAWGCSRAGGRVLRAQVLLPVWVLLLWVFALHLSVSLFRREAHLCHIVDSTYR